MIYLLLSIICSVSVGVLFKLARKSDGLTFFQMISWNYLFGAILCYFTYTPQFDIKELNIPWGVFISLMILLPSIFLIQANSVKYVGIVRTDIAQRLSLIISLSAAYFLFKENFSFFKIWGIIIGFISIFLILSKQSSEVKASKWYYPILVLIGFGVIDVLFKKVALFKAFSYTSSLFIIFCGAFIISVFIILIQTLGKKKKLSFKNIYWGFILGLLNFGNILFYLKAHQVLRDNPSTVFASMNFGVIILGSTVGVLFFKEKMSKINYFGLGGALMAILLISLS